MRHVADSKIETCGEPGCYRPHDWVYPDEDNIAVRAHCPGVVHWCSSPGCDGVCADLHCEGEPHLRRSIARRPRYRPPWWARALRWLLRL